jgi:hypothetical protein
MLNIKLCKVLVAGLLITSAAKADLFWFNSLPILDFDGNEVASDQFDSSISAFAQLIFAGANGVADSFAASASGVTGDDVVAAIMHAGQNDFLFFLNPGLFPLQEFPAVIGSGGNGNYFVRVFDSPSASFGAGLAASVPTSGYYWQSEIHTFTHEDPPSPPDNWDFAPLGGQTLTVVPEPSVMAIMGLGLFGLAAARRRLQS